MPIIAVRLGIDPYGFIGKFQGLNTTWPGCPEQLVKLLIKHDHMVNAYLRAVQRCINYDDGNTLAKILPDLQRLSQQQIDDLVATYNNRTQLRGSWGFNGTPQMAHGRGLVSHLNRLGSRNYKYDSDGLIVEVK